MKQILLVCSAGMSTSLLVTKMEGAAKDAGYDAKIFALPFSDAPRVLEDVDVILLGPQVIFCKCCEHEKDGVCNYICAYPNIPLYEGCKQAALKWMKQPAEEDT